LKNSLKKYLLDILAFIAAVLMLTGLYLVYYGMGGVLDGSKYNVYLIIAGLIILIPFIWMAFKGKRGMKQMERDYEEFVEHLKKTGKHYKIPVSQIEVLSNDYLQENTKGHGKYEKTVYKEVFHNVLLFQINLNGKTYKYRKDVYLKPEILRMHLLLKDELDMYVNPQNPEEFYLDTSFMEK